MSAGKHTPGPWLRDKYGNLVDSNGRRVSFRAISILCASSEEFLAEAEANTDLATAAPELLHALEMMILFNKPMKGNAVALNAAYQAIAKATGTAK